MAKIISMQDMRVSLARIADQAEAGETFIVVRSSKPVFRIVPPSEPVQSSGTRALSLAEITGKLDAREVGYDVSADEVDRIIHEAHADYGKR